MVDQNDVRNGLVNENLSGFHHESGINGIVLDGMNGRSEHEREGEDSGSNASPEEDYILAGDNNTNLIPEQDRFLPIANIGRIMKRAVPVHGKIAKEAKECVQECVSEFIGFLTSEASDKCLNEKRKTITVEDMLTAMRVLDLDEYADVLTTYMKRFREAHRGRGDQIDGVGLFGMDITEDELLDSGPSGVDVNSDNFPTVAVPGINGGEPHLVRVLPSNAQVVLDTTTGRHYVTWLTPQGEAQILQVTGSHTVDAFPTVAQGLSVPASISSEANCAATETNNTTVSSNSTEASLSNRIPPTFQSPQNFRPVAHQLAPAVPQSRNQGTQGSLTVPQNAPRAHFSRSVANLVAQQVRPSSTSNAQFVRPTASPATQAVRPAGTPTTHFVRPTAAPSVQFARPTGTPVRFTRPAGNVNTQFSQAPAASVQQLTRSTGASNAQFTRAASPTNSGPPAKRARGAKASYNRYQ